MTRAQQTERCLKKRNRFLKVQTEAFIILIFFIKNRSGEQDSFSW